MPSIKTILEQVYSTEESLAEKHQKAEEAIRKHYYLFQSSYKAKVPQEVREALDSQEKDVELIGQKISYTRGEGLVQNGFNRLKIAYANDNTRTGMNPDTKYERSVYFGFSDFENWLSQAEFETGKIGADGFRIYFAENDVRLAVDPPSVRRFTLVFRPMRENADGTLVQIEHSPLNTDYIAYNIGGICPPNCNGANPRYENA